MKINLNSNFNLGESFSTYATKKAEEQITKYFDNAINASVFVSKTNNVFKMNMVVNDGVKRGILIKATAESDDIYHAFDLTLAKISRQLRKHKSKLVTYKKKINGLKAKNTDLPYIIANRSILKEDIKHELEENEDSSLNIIAEKETEIEELTPEEAIMKMELINLPAYMFINKDNSLVNVVYKRPDGNYSWINPKNNK